MHFSGYLSKHLYSRIVTTQSQQINTPLDEQELEALKEFDIPYKKITNDDGYPIYILDTKSLKAIFCT